MQLHPSPCDPSPIPRPCDPSPCDPSPILDLLNGFRRSKVLFALVSLGVPDLLAQHERAGDAEAGAAPAQLMPLAALAAAVGSGRAAPDQPQAAVSLDGLGRLCDAGVALGLLAGGSTAGGYGLTELARTYLCAGSELSLAGYVRHSDAIIYKLFGHLEASVRSGQACWQEAFGLSSQDVFASLYTDDAAMLRFMHGMHGFSQLSAAAVLTAFDLSSRRHLVDLGGATGALAVAACGLHPALRATVVDLPHVVDKARAHFAASPAVRSVEGRLSWAAADFFGPPEDLPAGDCFVLSRILHDWEDSRCAALLATVHAKLPRGGCLLLSEMVLDEGCTSPPEVVLQSLNMLCQTHGRERTLAEFRQLLEAAGFSRVEGKATGTYFNAIIAWKD